MKFAKNTFLIIEEICQLLLIFRNDLMKENKFQRDLIKEIKERFPGCLVFKNDPNYIQGVPDLTVLYGKQWALLECKKSAHEEHQPNQDYYIERGNDMSIARFIYPENRTEVLDELQQTFKPRR
jgi:hypothetical protein